MSCLFMFRCCFIFFFFSSRRLHTRWNCDWSSDVCSSDLDRRLVDHREDARHAEADLADVGVGRVAELADGAAAEHLGPRPRLDVDLHADHDIPAHAPRPYPLPCWERLATSARTPLATSYARATRRATSSRHCGASTCRPT